MIETIWRLAPVAVGVMASPIAVMALIGILLSRNARLNGVAYLMGWVLCSGALTALAVSVVTVVDATGAYREAAWVPAAHLTVGVICLAGAVWTVMRARTVVAGVAAARSPDELARVAPQLPRLVRSVETYTPRRSFVLGLIIFLSPMNIALVAAAGIEIVLAGLPAWQSTPMMIGFVVASAIPVAVPVVTVLARGDDADPLLQRLRLWMLDHNGYLSAVIFTVVGILQIIKAFQGWLS